MLCGSLSQDEVFPIQQAERTFSSGPASCLHPGSSPPLEKGLWFNLFISEGACTQVKSFFQGNTQLPAAKLTCYFRAALPLASLISQSKNKILFIRTLMISPPPHRSLLDTSIGENCMDNFESRGFSGPPLQESCISRAFLANLPMHTAGQTVAQTAGFESFTSTFSSKSQHFPLFFSQRMLQSPGSRFAVNQCLVLSRRIGGCRAVVHAEE